MCSHFTAKRSKRVDSPNRAMSQFICQTTILRAIRQPEVCNFGSLVHPDNCIDLSSRILGCTRMLTQVTISTCGSVRVRASWCASSHVHSRSSVEQRLGPWSMTLLMTLSGRFLLILGAEREGEAPQLG